jgi:hypothetical protein
MKAAVNGQGLTAEPIPQIAERHGIPPQAGTELFIQAAKYPTVIIT